MCACVQLPGKQIRKHFLDMVISNLCEHPPTRHFIVSALLTALHRFGKYPDPLRLLAASEQLPHEPLIPAEAPVDDPALVSCSLDLLGTIARLGSVRLFLFRSCEDDSQTQAAASPAHAQSDSKEEGLLSDSKEEAQPASAASSGQGSSRGAVLPSVPNVEEGDFKPSLLATLDTSGDEFSLGRLGLPRLIVNLSPFAVLCC